MFSLPEGGEHAISHKPNGVSKNCIGVALPNPRSTCKVHRNKGSFRNHDGDSNEDGKKAIGLGPVNIEVRDPNR